MMLFFGRQRRPCAVPWIWEDFPVSISRWGWDAYFEALWNEGAWDSALPARVVGQQRKFWRIASDSGECWAEAAGKLRLAAEEQADWPAVGDWVAVDLRPAGDSALILGVLPRRSRFARKAAGKKMEEQVIAANVDTVLLVCALDGDFNPRRVERYLAQCWESGAKPVIVLNKADACADPREKAAEMDRIALASPVYVVSAKTGQGIDELEPFLKPGNTVAMLGSSGVGKSTLLNLLLGDPRQEVREVRESDSRGRHTTTSRELLLLPGGALLMDTPGLRELQLWDAEEGLTETFREIDELAERCRFSDCRHEGEPGCAVRGVRDRGSLTPARLENRRKLLREQEFLRRKLDPEARQQQKEQWKGIHRAARQKYQQRHRDGGKR
jgi:ribosome biogenesis GTPase / thiamine phosphate phosphatase